MKQTTTTFTHSFGSPFPLMFLFVAILFINMCLSSSALHVECYLLVVIFDVCVHKERKDHPLGKTLVLRQRREGNEKCIHSGRFRSLVLSLLPVIPCCHLLLPPFSHFLQGLLSFLSLFSLSSISLRLSHPSQPPFHKSCACSCQPHFYQFAFALLLLPQNINAMSHPKDNKAPSPDVVQITRNDIEREHEKVRLSPLFTIIFSGTTTFLTPSRTTPLHFFFLLIKALY